MIELVRENRTAIAELCRRFRVERLDLFGSAGSGAFNSTSSDLDFVVRFAGSTTTGYADRYYDFAVALEELLHRRVDLITEAMIRNPYFREEVQRSRTTIYDERGQEIPS